MKMYTDGGCKPNPGKMAIAVTDEKGNVLLKRFIGEGTNNIAEYTAAMEAIGYCIFKGITDLTILTDSNLVYNQYNNNWKVNDAGFKIFLRWMKSRTKHFRHLSIEKINREDNLAGKVIEQMWKEEKRKLRGV